MKTTEEKSKAYDKAMKWIESIYSNLSHEQQIEAETFFPELKESEDEKVRKELIDIVKKSPITFAFEDKNKVLAWLEKQDEKLPVGFYYVNSEGKKFYSDTFKYGDVILHVEKPYDPAEINPTEFDTRLQSLIGKFKSLPKEELIGSLSFWLNVVQNDGTYKEEEKPVELKFKVGDWITDGQLIYKVLGVTDKSYELHLYNDDYCHFETDVQSIDKHYHLWTIKDAKPGDVLFHSDSASNGIFIFKEIIDKGFANKVICYCDYDSEDHFCLGEHHTCCWTDAKILYPATKEQHDLLFTKMKENGYEWYAEKKELKKIENEPKEGWSKEDEQIIEDIIYDINIFLEDAKKFNKDIETYKKEINWLKSIKDKVKYQNIWKPSNDQMYYLSWIANVKLGDGVVEQAVSKSLNSLYDDLKKLKGD